MMLLAILLGSWGGVIVAVAAWCILSVLFALALAQFIRAGKGGDDR
jgi:hypothetical protein